MAWKRGQDSALATLLVAMAKLNALSARILLQEKIIRGLQQMHGVARLHGLAQEKKRG